MPAENDDLCMTKHEINHFDLVFRDGSNRYACNPQFIYCNIVISRQFFFIVEKRVEARWGDIKTNQFCRQFHSGISQRQNWCHMRSSTHNSMDFCDFFFGYQNQHNFQFLLFWIIVFRSLFTLIGYTWLRCIGFATLITHLWSHGKYKQNFKIKRENKKKKTTYKRIKGHQGTKIYNHSTITPRKNNNKNNIKFEKKKSAKKISKKNNNIDTHRPFFFFVFFLASFLRLAKKVDQKTLSKHSITNFAIRFFFIYLFFRCCSRSFSVLLYFFFSFCFVFFLLFSMLLLMRC